MMKASDFSLRKAKQEMLVKLTAIVNKYKQLNDARWTLAEDPKIIADTIKKYTDLLKKPITNFFVGTAYEKTIKQANENFDALIKKYIEIDKVKVDKRNEQFALDGVKNSVIRKIDEMVANTDYNLRSRAMEIRSAADNGAFAAVQSEEDFTQIKFRALVLQTENQRYAKFDEKLIDQKWEDLTEKYGGMDTVKYRNGANMPLNTYIAGRSTTTSNEVHIMATQTRAALMGIYTGKVSTHNASDSCKIYEGKIVCYSAESRDMLSQQIPEARSWPTVEDLRNDKESHILKFNCAHTIDPYPVHLFSAADQQEVIRANAA